MKTFFTVVWFLIRVVFAISRFLLMKLVFGPLLHMVRPFFAAVRYLTILPIPKRLGGRRKDLARSLVHFPLVGLLLGAMVGPLALFSSLLFQELVAGALVVLALVVLSRGRTLQGLARSVDGLLAPDPQECLLEEAPTSAIGGAGVVAIVLALILKFAAIAETEWRAAALIPLAGRCAMVVAMRISPFVPEDEPRGRVRFRHRTPLGAILCAVWAGLVLVVLAWWVQAGFPDLLHVSRKELGDWDWWLLGSQGVVAAVVALGAAALAAWFVRRRIGGATPDTLGGVCEIAEVVMIVLLAPYELRFVLGHALGHVFG